jgi:hypothetical protein
MPKYDLGFRKEIEVSALIFVAERELDEITDPPSCWAEYDPVKRIVNDILLLGSPVDCIDNRR